MRKEVITCDGCGKKIDALFYTVERRRYIGPFGDERIDFLGLRNPADYCSLDCLVKAEKVIE